MFIGIDRDTGLIYEGNKLEGGHGLWPAPVFTRASFLLVGNKSEDEEGYLTNPHIQYIFREDSFDPVTRIRRGRFYFEEEVKKWMVTIHPLGEHGLGNISKFAPLAINKNLNTFSDVKTEDIFPHFPAKRYAVRLGARGAIAAWNVISVEAMSTGEDLVTLRSRSSLGSFPELIIENISKLDRASIQATANNLISELHLAGPESIIDHCRDLTEWILRAKIRSQEYNFEGKELEKLIFKFEDLFPELKNIPNSAQIVRRLHGRRKTAIIDTAQPRPLLIQDAEHAVLCVGSILCDLNWGRWI